VPDRRKAFTLTEVLIAVAISGFLFFVVVVVLNNIVDLSGDEGTVANGTGIAYSLSPSSGQTTAALSVPGQLRAEFADATWVLPAASPEVVGANGVNPSIIGLGTQSPLTLSSPTAFQSFMAGAPNNFIFSTNPGFSVFGIGARNQLIGVLSVQTADSGGYRFYDVSYRRATATVPTLSYSFCEPLSSLQTGTGCVASAVGNRTYLSITLPDPAVTYSKLCASLSRTISDPTALATAEAALPRASQLTLALPSVR
jgi:prepilin-type N-terminal cleavage/methylation domain-containing protein